jgi:MFS superfamily sulfate permease-like transporter
MIWTWLWELCPTWLGGLLLTTLLLGVFWWAQRWQARWPQAPQEDSPVMSAVIGLLALLLAFTFNMGIERYNVRRDLVLQEANALGTTYLRLQLLDLPARETLTHALQCYGQVRLSFFQARENDQALDQIYHQTDLWQTRIWNQLITLNQKSPPSDAVLSRLLDTTNQLFDLALSRRTALEARIPALVIEVLTWVSLLSAFLVGYCHNRPSYKQWTVITLLFLIMGLVMMLILDLDRPRSGWIMISQTPLELTINAMKKPGQPPLSCQEPDTP